MFELTLTALISIVFMFFINIIKNNRHYFFISFTFISYSIFPILGYYFYPTRMNLVSGSQVYSNNVYYLFTSFIFIFLIIFLAITFYYDKRIKINLLDKIEFQKIEKNKFLLKIFYTLCFLVIIYSCYMIIKNFKELDYTTQYILKENKLWFYIFDFQWLLSFILIVKFKNSNKKFEKNIILLLLAFILLIFLTTSIKAGQRLGLVKFLICIICFYIIKKPFSLTLKNITKFSAISFTILVFLSIIRYTRGKNLNSINQIIETLGEINFFSFENLIFQDWAIPLMSLSTSIAKELINPLFILKTEILTLIPFIERRSLGEWISRLIDPYGITGYGYSVITESYNLFGFAGSLIGPFIIFFGFKLLFSLFTKTTDVNFNLCIISLINALTIDIVRGSFILFLKGIYLYFIPFLVTYCLANNYKFTIKWTKN